VTALYSLSVNDSVQYDANRVAKRQGDDWHEA
jgi:hypothetical protein